MAPTTTRIGLIGYGQIGSAVCGMIDGDDTNGMEVVFIHDADPDRLTDVEDELILFDLSEFETRRPDLVVEMAHPDATKQWGPTILAKTDYMGISVTALADAEFENQLRETSLRHGTRAYVPHGGAVGIDALLENRDSWESVHCVMKKPPKNVDCAAAGVDADSITEETCLYDGPTRGACPLFPRNVNTLAAIAYASIGLDRTHATLIVNPEWNTAIVSVHAKSPDVELKIERSEAIAGVTGASTPASIYNSIQMIGSKGPGIHLR